MTHPVVPEFIFHDLSERCNGIKPALFGTFLECRVCVCVCVATTVSPFRPAAATTYFLLCFVLCSGSSRPAEVALQHQPAAAEPAPTDEGGRRRGRQGQRAKGVTTPGDGCTKTDL